MKSDEKITYIINARQVIMNAANDIIEIKMKEYVEKFGWDPIVDVWLWNGVNDCGIGYLIAVGNSINTVNKLNKQEED